jgi:hypothetical protein
MDFEGGIMQRARRGKQTKGLAMCKGLSKLQHRIMAAIANATVNTYDTDEPTEVSYRNVFRAVQGHWYGGVPAIAGEHRYLAAKVAYSRAVTSLIERGLVEGIALGWAAVPTGEVIRWQGGGRDDRPRLKMLGLTAAGWAVAGHQAHQDAAAGIETINETNGGSGPGGAISSFSGPSGRGEGTMMHPQCGLSRHIDRR